MTILGDASATDTTKTEPVTDAKPVVADAKVETTPEQVKAAADKAALEAGALPFTDIKQLGEGKFDPKTLADFLPIAKEHGLTAKQAQALVAFDGKRAEAFEAARVAAKETASKAAVDSLKADPEIGGANWEKSMGLAAKALAYLGNPELNAALNALELADGSMLGDSPVIAKLLVNLGKKVAAIMRAADELPARARDAYIRSDLVHRHEVKPLLG